jgi:hypothetical protein
MGFFLIYLYLIYRIVMKMHLNSIKCLINQADNNFPHFVYDQLGYYYDYQKNRTLVKL